ncbi:TBC1 domain family member 15-like [Ptychodera flava]|uniref:TBC1 domain family member 15-like n=1 Tax=Ptychodera flava TaxID=63121 RepID=UPI003969CF51
MAAPKSRDRIVFEKGGVFIHTAVGTSEDEDTLLGGRVRLIDKGENQIIEWNPLSDCEIDDEQPDKEWAVINSVGYKKQNSREPEKVTVQQPTRKSKYAMSFPLTDLRSIKRSKPSLGWSYLLFVLKDGVTLPALHFHEGGSKEMMRRIQFYVTITRSTDDPRQFLVTPHDTTALSKSINELHLFGETSASYVSKFFKDPYSATMGGFSKVTNFLKDSLSAQTTQNRPIDEAAELMPDLPRVEINPRMEPGYELITQSVLGARPDVKRADPLIPEEWQKHCDSDGRVVRIHELIEKIFHGGLYHSVRKEVWKFLLNYYEWSSTQKDRSELRKKKEDDYFKMKLQWKSITDEQAKRNSTFRDRICLVDKDVSRTDRTHPCFEGQNNPNTAMLYDILMTYCQYNFDLGYVQGMSDLLSPILVVMENEVDSFWCFAGFMEMEGVRNNFDLDQEGMKKQLIDLSTLLHFLDPELYNYLESKDSSNLYFCFRWLLIKFKREFTFADIMRLWEVMWTGLPCPNFHLLICLAILDTEKQTMMKQDYGFNEILKHINDLSLSIDTDDTLKKAEGIFLQLSQCEQLPGTIKDILGLCNEDNSNGQIESIDSPGSSIEMIPNPEAESAF